MNHYHCRIFVDRGYFDKYDDDHLMCLYNHEQNIRFRAIRIDMLHLYEENIHPAISVSENV
jgi:hypothetical protein